MSILNKPLDAITLDDLLGLVSAGARETGELEFKGTLPSKKATPDPWLSGSGGVGEHARNELLSEIVGFANSDGGTLVLGLHESSGNARRAERLEPLPNCEELAKRLLDASQDVIEPRLNLDARGIPANSDGSGYVVIRTGKSLYGPHRLTTTREFYIRRGERNEKMTAREIQDLALNLARTGDQIETLFQERRMNAETEFALMERGGSSLSVRVTAFPMIIRRITGLTLRNELWWTGGALPMTIGDQPFEYPYPAREFGVPPRIRLRSFEQDRDLKRLLRDDGLIECRLLHPPARASRSEKDGHAGVYLAWLAGLVVGTLAQVSHVRKHLAWDGVEYGLEVEIWAGKPLDLIVKEGSWEQRSLMQGEFPESPMRFPRYSVRSGADSLNTVVSEFVRDLYNSVGTHWRSECVIQWN
jgi:hypothetical protein